MGISQFVAVIRGVVVRDYGHYKEGSNEAAELVREESRTLYPEFGSPIEAVAVSGEPERLRVGDRVVVDEDGVATLD